MANTENLKQQIKLNSQICGISSPEVAFAKSLVENKCKDKTLFVCEGLWAVEKLIEKNNNVLAIVMDGLEQPGNIGAILRSFDSAGGDFAIVTNKQARLSNSRLVRSSLGASFMLPVLEAEIDEVQAWLENHDFKCVVTDLQAKKSYREIDYSGRIAIISGNEHTGISDSWRKLPHAQSIIIPMLGSVESLNVGFASTLVSYEAGLQKFGNSKNK